MNSPLSLRTVSPARPSELHQHPAFQEHVILAVAVTVFRIGPFLDHAVMLEVGHRLDVVVHVAVDAFKLLERGLGELHIARLGRLRLAFPRPLLAELYPTDRRPCRFADRDISHAFCRSRPRWDEETRGREQKQRPARQSRGEIEISLGQHYRPLSFSWGQCGKRLLSSRYFVRAFTSYS